MIKAIHLGDIHPNSKATFAGKTVIDPDTGENLALTDLRKSLEFVFRQATKASTRCDLVLIAGDLFDSVAPTMNEVRVIRPWLQALAEEMPVCVISGNHDLSQNTLDATALEAIKGIANIHVVERPQSLLLDINGEQVQIFCLPYPTKSRLLAHDAAKDKSPEEITAIINQGLAAILRGFVSEQIPGIPHVLLAHGSVANAKVGDQPRSLDHDILIPREEFDRFDLVALGHIHQPQRLSETAHYSGSLVRASFGEEHEDKGFNLVELTTGQPATVKHLRNPHARMYCTINRAMLEEANGYADGLQPDMVWRFKDAMTDEERQALQPTLDRLSATTPWFQVDIERVDTTRARDAGMSAVMTTDDALLRALATMVEASELPGLLEKHRALEDALA